MFGMTTHRRTVVRLCGLLAAVSVTMGSATCRHGSQFDLDPKFSVNLARPGEGFPNLKKMSPAEIEVYEKHGTPDFFRIWYNSRGELATSIDAGPAIRAKKVKQRKRSWIYEEKKIEIVFSSPAKFTEKSLTDKLGVLCYRGDPQARDRQILKEGALRETWTYYDVGEIYVFVDGNLAKKQYIKRLPGVFNRI